MRPPILRALPILALAVFAGCADWSAVERAELPRLASSAAPAPVSGGIGVPTVFTLAIENSGLESATLTLEDAIVQDWSGAALPDDVGVVFVGALPTVAAQSSVDLQLEVTPAQALEAGVLELVFSSTPESTPVELVVDVPFAVAADWDGDGADHTAAGGNDCNDQDATISPDAAEVWYDGVDQDCDGNDTDADEDGYSVSDDCNDDEPTAFPGGTEVWYDGIDQDCDGNDADQDGDGFASTEVGGADCNDLDATVQPGVADGGIVGEDDDCDGLTDEDDATEGMVVLTEVMRASRNGASATWFEVYNTTDHDVVIGGWTVRTDTVITEVVLTADSPPLAPDASLVVCADPTVAASLAIPCAATLADWPALNAASDSIQLSVERLEVDRLRWSAAWPGGSSVALSLDPRAYDSVDNDDASAWCDATGTWLDDELGSPGQVNPRCSASVAGPTYTSP